MRFYLDENLSPKVAEIARERGVDVLSSHECGRNRLDDEDQLRLAAEEGRCLVTYNRDDFTDLAVRFFELAWPHAGVVIVSPFLLSDQFAAIAAALIEYDRQHQEGLPEYMIGYLHPI